MFYLVWCCCTNGNVVCYCCSVFPLCIVWYKAVVYTPCPKSTVLCCYTTLWNAVIVGVYNNEFKLGSACVGSEMNNWTAANKHDWQILSLKNVIHVASHRYYCILFCSGVRTQRCELGTSAFPLLSFRHSFISVLFLPRFFSPLIIFSFTRFFPPFPLQLGGLRERFELPQWGVGRNPGRNRI